MPNNPHDKVFKVSLSDLELARELIVNYLPNELVKQIDFKSLKLAPSAFHNKKLSKSEADILYSCNLLASGKSIKPAYIYILIEHQSSQDKLLALRIHEYTLSIWRQHLKAGHKSLPIVMPLVVYAGAKKYKHSTDLYDLFESKPLAKEFLLKPIQLLDVTGMEKKDFQSLQKLALLFLVLKLRAIKQSIRFSHWVIDLGLVDMFNNLLDSDYMFTLLFYLADDPMIEDEADLLTSLSNLGIDEKELNMSYSQKLYQEAHQKGHQQGHQLGRRLGHQQGLDEGLRRGHLSGITEGRRRGHLSGITEGRRKGHIEGKQEGKQEGHNEAIKQTVRAMLAQGFDVKMIQKITKLSSAKIKELELV